jgi:Mrp family chromosome partitioning ATPase
MGIINNVKGAIDAVVGGIQSALSWVGNLWDKITGAGNAAAAIPAVASAGPVVAAAATSPSLARSLAAPRAAAGTSSGGGISIVVNGALDPDAVGRQIESILRGRGRRSGPVIV